MKDTNLSLRGGEKIVEPVFEIFKDSQGKFRFRLKAPNGEIIAVGQGYKRKENCKKGIKSLKKNAPKAKTVELESGKVDMWGRSGWDTQASVLIIIAMVLIFSALVMMSF